MELTVIWGRPALSLALFPILFLSLRKGTSLNFQVSAGE